MAIDSGRIPCEDQRRYTMEEIDAMRGSVKMLARHSDGPEAVEAMLRTYMLNGSTVAELRDAAEKRTVERQVAFEASIEMQKKYRLVRG